MSGILLKPMKSSHFAHLSGLDLVKLSILARFCKTFVIFDDLSGFALPIPPGHAESPHVRNSIKTNGILTICSLERLRFSEIINISQVLQYFCDPRSPRTTKKCIWFIGSVLFKETAANKQNTLFRCSEGIGGHKNIAKPC